MTRGLEASESLGPAAAPGSVGRLSGAAPRGGAEGGPSGPQAVQGRRPFRAAGRPARLLAGRREATLLVASPAGAADPTQGSLRPGSFGPGLFGPGVLALIALRFLASGYIALAALAPGVFVPKVFASGV